MVMRMMFGVLVAGSIALAAPTSLWAGEAAVNKDIEQLNRLTGMEPTEGMLRQLLDDPEKTQNIIKAALPLAQKKEGLGYNAALVLGLAAADQKNLKACDTFLHHCAAIAAKEQSTQKLAQAYTTLIELYYDNKKYADAARICREVLDLKTDDGKPRLVYRAFTDESGETDFIEDHSFDSAKRLRPVIERELTRALTKQGKFEQALKLADKLIKNEVDWAGQYLKGWVLREAGQYEKAAITYQDVLNRVERDTDLDTEKRDAMTEQLRVELSNIFVDLKQIDRAAEQLEFLLKRKPEEPGFYNDLGYILADHDMRLDEAEKLIRKALELDLAKRKKSPKFDPKTDHDNGAYLDSLGWVLYKKKQLADARKYLELAVEDKAAQHIEIYDHLGDVCLALGDREAAIRAWEKGLEHVTESRRDQDRRVEVAKKLERAKSKSASK
jgi:tetratricopeptide (TPR) repeat protein